MREFNVTGVCNPQFHYVVDISNKLDQITALIDRRKYFTIHRARQYGKSTTLYFLQNRLKDHYICLKISFEASGTKLFESEESFCQGFLELLSEALQLYYDFDQICLGREDVRDFLKLSSYISELCRGKKIVLMIDEADRASNYQVFIYFLGVLRNQYNMRQERDIPAFYSVILAGVYDVKNIKYKMIQDGTYHAGRQETKLYNSPWNIAVDFQVDMSFQAEETATMLSAYEEDYAVGMDIPAVSGKIYEYTSGYPFMVSRICQCIHEELHRNWTEDGVQDAVKILLNEKNTLFDDVFKNLENHAELFQFIYELLVIGENKSYQIDNPLVDLGVTFGFFKNVHGKTAISNRVFELRILNYFISKDESSNQRKIKGVLPYDMIQDEKFDMELCLKKFAMHYQELFTEKDTHFLEKHGRMLFLTYLKPLINGKGFYHIESGLTDLRRMDIVVDYAKEQFILELKLWHGQAAHEEAYGQLISYMKSKGALEGYLLTFCFNKNKISKADWVYIEGMRILDVVV